VTNDEYVLDGPLERARFAPGLTLVAGLIVAFLAFQGTSLVALILLVVTSGQADSLAALAPEELIATYASEFLVANTVGQVLGLLLLGFVFTRLHTRSAGAFLRVRGADPGLVGLSLVGLAALIPIVQWLGALMDGLPWPDFVRAFDDLQLEIIEQVLASDIGLWTTLATMALTPAICEEVFFRGYIQRQAERATRSWLRAVVLTGILFGLYHLRDTQAVPLSLLGIYLCYVVWRSDSLLPGVLVHLANNGIAVAVGAWIASQSDVTVADIENMQVPAYILVASVLIFSVTVRAMHRRGARIASGSTRLATESEGSHGNEAV
jgi:membrane protease YdiL (CAAX protease family)